MGEAPKNSGRFGKGNPGKPKGAVTKTGKLAREAIAQAAESLGGADRLVAWAQEDPLNERAFWASIYPKLLPLQVTGEDGGPVQSETKATLDVSSLTPEQLRAIASIPLN
jgi:hypothetical protein